MGLAQRIFLIDAEDRLLRLPAAKLDRMLRHPASNPLPQSAGQRVKLASITVGLAAGEPVRLVRRSFAVLHFDQHGLLDIDRFGRQRAARFDAWIAPELGTTSRPAGVVEASSRFVAQGGTWTPSAGLGRAIGTGASECRFNLVFPLRLRLSGCQNSVCGGS